ncbi:MAG: PocR ligand-binding domain-containing protein [Ruminiclostridium sp.]
MGKKEINLLDVIDRVQLQSLQDAFAKATGMAALATDQNGPVTQLSNPTDFCMNYTRKSSVGCERCNLCDLKGGEQAKKTGRPAVYYCHGGLVDFASPIIVNGEQIGSLIGGQVLTDEPDLDKFRSIAAEIGVDPDEYVEAVKKVPIVSEEKVNNAAELLFKMAQALSQVGYEKYRISQEHSDSAVLFTEVHNDYAVINNKIEKVNTAIKELSEEFDRLREKALEAAKTVTQTDAILKYIQNVATQMTLLGFNASIEAKHVGEAGAGFNVIAQEVRQLAEQTSSQTHEIEDVLSSVRSSIGGIEKEIAAAMEKINNNVTIVDELSRQIAETSEKIDKISNA